MILYMSAFAYTIVLLYMITHYDAWMLVSGHCMHKCWL